LNLLEVVQPFLIEGLAGGGSYSIVKDLDLSERLLKIIRGDE